MLRTGNRKLKQVSVRLVAAHSPLTIGGYYGEIEGFAYYIKRKQERVGSHSIL